MFKTRSHWTRTTLGVLVGTLAAASVAFAGPANRGSTPTKPAREIVRAEKAVQKMARQQEKASNAAARRAQQSQPPRSSAGAPNKGNSRTYTTSRPSSGRNYGGGQHGPSSKSYGHSNSKHYNHGHYKPKSYSYTTYKPSFSIGIGLSSCGSVGHVCTSACFGYRSSCYPYRYYRPSFGYCAPSYAYCGPSYGYCGPSVVYKSYSYSSYPSSRYIVGSVDYFPSGGGVTTWENQAAGDSNAYYAWQRDVSLPDTPAIAGVNASPEPAPARVAPAPAPAGSGDLLADAWTALAAGDSKTAMGYFATVADSAPELVQPKVGYAIAAAKEGQIRPAAWSLRRAWTESPDSIGYLPTSEGMTKALDALAQDLQRRAIAGEGTADLWFVAATVDYLRFQPEQAKAAAERAKILGDEHPSLAALTRRLESDQTGR